MSIPKGYTEEPIEVRAVNVTMPPDGRQVPLLNVYMSDGPIFERVLKKSIIGRVVGVYRPKAAAVGI